VLLAHIRSSRSIPWFLLAGSLVLTGGTLLLTQSRGAWLGLAAALAALGAIISRPLRKVIGFAALVGLAAFIVVGPTEAGAWLFGSQTQEFTGTLSIDFRLHVWRVAIWGAGDFPFTGMGLGTFRRVARVLYPLPIPADYDIAHAHNHFLQAAVDLGLPGLVAYAALWLGAAHLLIKTYRSTQDGRLSALALGLGGGALAYFVYGLTDAVALGAKPGFIFWMTFGLIVAIHQLSVRDMAPSENPHDQLASVAV
jgi:putative inorganic carbon (HCO3(-)) transporter